MQVEKRNAEGSEQDGLSSTLYRSVKSDQGKGNYLGGHQPNRKPGVDGARCPLAVLGNGLAPASSA